MGDVYSRSSPAPAGSRQSVPAWRPLGWGFRGAALLDAAKLPEALTTIETALAESARTGHCYHDAELLRLKGELLLRAQSHRPPFRDWSMDDLPATAEACFHRALEVARIQQARALQRRAAISLCQHPRAGVTPRRARATLAAIVDVFPERVDSPDLRTARALLAERLPAHARSHRDMSGSWELTMWPGPFADALRQQREVRASINRSRRPWPMRGTRPAFCRCSTNRHSASAEIGRPTGRCRD